MAPRAKGPTKNMIDIHVIRQRYGYKCIDCVYYDYCKEHQKVFSDLVEIYPIKNKDWKHFL